MPVSRLLDHVINTHRRREIMLLLILAPVVALGILFNQQELKEKETATKIKFKSVVEQVVSQTGEGSNVVLDLDGEQKKLFFRCRLSVGDQVSVVREEYADGSRIYFATECRF